MPSTYHFDYTCVYKKQLRPFKKNRGFYISQIGKTILSKFKNK